MARLRAEEEWKTRCNICYALAKCLNGGGSTSRERNERMRQLAHTPKQKATPLFDTGPELPGGVVQ
jgi:hypothetical protein